MNNKFDELAKGVAQSVTRRQALMKFGFGVVGLALGCFGLTNVARAAEKNCLPVGSPCGPSKCCKGLKCVPFINPNGGFREGNTCQPV